MWWWHRKSDSMNVLISTSLSGCIHINIFSRTIVYERSRTKSCQMRIFHRKITDHYIVLYIVPLHGQTYVNSYIYIYMGWNINTNVSRIDHCLDLLNPIWRAVHTFLMETWILCARPVRSAGKGMKRFTLVIDKTWEIRQRPGRLRSGAQRW